MRLDPVRRAALVESARAWALAHVLCWMAGLGAIVVFGAHTGSHDTLGSTTPFDGFGDTVIGPFARWDSVWYLLIADHGYPNAIFTNFYPLYPLFIRVAGAPVGSSLVGGMLVSAVGSLAATYILQRIAALEVGEEKARRTMLLFAFFPTAVFFSAVYAEGLFLALALGAVYAARRGRWAWAGTLGGLAAITRPPGLILVVPLVLLLLYGPRADRRAPPERPGLRPRYPIGRELLWVLAVPAAFLVYAAYLGAELGEPLAMLHQRRAWNQQATLPLLTLVRATREAGRGLTDVAHGGFPNNIYEFGFVCMAIAGAVGALRRLPLAYGAYAAGGVTLLLTYPIHGTFVSGFSRYMAPLFPILIWLAAWTSERRVFRWVLLGFAVVMVINSARFATWQFVA